MSHLSIATDEIVQSDIVGGVYPPLHSQHMTSGLKPSVPWFVPSHRVGDAPLLEVYTEQALPLASVKPLSVSTHVGDEATTPFLSVKSLAVIAAYS